MQKICVEHGLWNAKSYDTRGVVSIDMKSCYPASFQGHEQAAQGQGEAKTWFERFVHPRHRMTRVDINGPFPKT